MPVELIVGAAVGAAVASPEVRRVVRRGLVYGLAGVLVAFDKVSEATHSAIASARQVADGAEKPKETPGPVAEKHDAPQTNHASNSEATAVTSSA